MASTGHLRIANALPSPSNASTGEAGLVALLSIQLVFMPWAVGSVHLWSQWVVLAFSVASFGYTLAIRRGATPAASDSAGFRARLRAIAKSPIAWAGGGVAVYLVIQALNPAWVYRTDGDYWWLEPRGGAPWLPSSVAAPFERASTWRSVIRAVALWLFAMSLLIGFTRRASFHMLYRVLVANGATLAALGIVQKLRQAPAMFGVYHPSNHHFFGTFIYPNHAGAYLNLIFALSIGLLMWRRHRETTTPTIAERASYFFSVVIALGVVFTYSRLAVGLLASALVVLAFVAVRWSGVQGMRPMAARVRSWAVVGGILALFALGAGPLVERFAVAWEGPIDLLRDRLLAQHATLDMFRDRWLFGWGGDCFQYGFPLYAQHYSGLTVSAIGLPRLWEHAHTDYLETAAELGVVGLIPLAVIGGWFVRRLSLTKPWLHPANRWCVIGCGLVLAHALLDFPFHSQAVTFTWAAVVVHLIRTPELVESAGLRLRSPRSHPSLVSH